MKHILTTFFLLSIALYGYPCDCPMFPIESYINKVDIIFTGKVIEILDTISADNYIDTSENRKFHKDKGSRVRVVIIEKLKTGQLQSDTLEFISDLSNCDPKYKLNESYLFFADKTQNGKFKMAHCTYWGTLNESRKNIKKLRAKLKNKTYHH